MECPHCGYLDGWNSETLSNIEGDEDGFYKSPIMLERQEPESYSPERKTIYGCPKCKKTFIS